MAENRKISHLLCGWEIRSMAERLTTMPEQLAKQVGCFSLLVNGKFGHSNIGANRD
jgi:hypothetical protein